MTPVYQTRPGADAIIAANAPASEVHPGIWMSPGLSNSYLIVTSEGRVVVNTGMGFEAPVHRANYDAVDSSPIRYVILTQGHYDHVGGADLLCDAGTDIVMQANWESWRRDNDLLATFRSANAYFRWNVRAIWEAYAGWFRHHSTTEPYAVAPEDFSGDVVALAGADAIVGRARKELADREPVRAIRLAETVRHVEPHHDGAKHVLRAAHEHLLEASTNFWESAWLRKQIADLT